MIAVAHWAHLHCKVIRLCCLGLPLWFWSDSEILCLYLSREFHELNYVYAHSGIFVVRVGGELPTLEHSSTGVGEPVDKEIANSASYLIMNRLENKVLSDTSAKYLPPSNCTFLDTPKVNSAIWDNLSQWTRTRDLKLQRVQRSLTRGLLAFAQSLSSQTITETQQDSLALIGNANYELNSLRKEFIKREMNEAYSHLCKPLAPVTKFLFRDELRKCMKDLKEEQRAAAGAVKTQQDKPTYRTHQRYHPYKPQNFAKFQDAGWTSSKKKHIMNIQYYYYY